MAKTITWFKRDPLIVGLIGAALVITAAEGWWLSRVRGEAVRAVSLLELKNRERDDLRVKSPAPTEENELAVARDLASARTKLSEIETVFGGGAEAIAGISQTKPTDAYFEIASFVEKARALAAQAQVTIRPDERFGFASHASEGPAATILPGVLRQRAAIQVLLEILMAARPVALISVQREHPSTATSHAIAGDAADFFELVPAMSLRKPGMLETDAFKLEFTGQTRVLREFINQLASVNPAFAVRSVEEEPAAAVANSSTVTSKTAVAVPIIVGGLSRFRVVVERLRPVTGLEKAER